MTANFFLLSIFFHCVFFMFWFLQYTPGFKPMAHCILVYITGVGLDRCPPLFMVFSIFLECWDSMI